MKYLNVMKALFFVIVAAGLSSCSSLNGSVGSYFNMDTDLQVDFVVDADINPDELDNPSPLFIRMYELKTSKMIKKADFIDIYERDKKVLGADMIAVHKLKRFKPGESRTEHFVLNKKTHYVAFYAEFLKFKDSKYKVVVPVVAENVIQTTTKVRVSGNELIVENGSEDSNDSDSNDMSGDVESSAKTTKDTAGKTKKLSSKTKELF